MNPFLALAIWLASDAAIELLVSTLNLKKLRAHVAHSVIPDTQLERTRDYTETQTRFSLVHLAFQLAIVLVAAGSGLFQTLGNWAAEISSQGWFAGLVFLTAVGALRWVAGLPFSIYRTFEIERRFGFNRTTRGVFVRDQALGLVLSAILGAPILAIIILFFETYPELGWFYSWAALTAFQLVLTFVAPALILPLFNRYEPISEGTLKKAIEAYAAREHFQLNGVFVMDGSKRSSKANAFFTGFGRFRKLVLLDTLVDKLNEEEILAVLSHEVGHFRLGHIPRTLALGVVTSFAGFYFLGWAMRSAALYEAFGMAQPAAPVATAAGLMFVGIAFGPLGRWLGIPAHALSRLHEFQADAFSSKSYGSPAALATALQKMSVDHLSNPVPHRLRIWMDYTHPPTAERVARLS